MPTRSVADGRDCRESVYENEAYTGVTYNDQTYSGRFFRRDKVMGFVALDRDACELALKKTFTPKLRPMDDWDRIDQPHMYDFLPHEVRDLAIHAQAQMWEHRLDPMRPKRNWTRRGRRGSRTLTQPAITFSAASSPRSRMVRR